MFEKITNSDELIEYLKTIEYFEDDRVSGKWARFKKNNGQAIIIYHDISLTNRNSFPNRESCFAFLPPNKTMASANWFYTYETSIEQLLLDKENKILVAPEGGIAFSL